MIRHAAAMGTRTEPCEGKGKAEIIRCLKRYVAREIFGYLCAAPKPTIQPGSAA